LGQFLNQNCTVVFKENYCTVVFFKNSSSFFRIVEFWWFPKGFHLNEV